MPNVQLGPLSTGLAVTGVSSLFSRYYGGDTNLLSGSGLNAWQSSVVDNPWLLSGDLVPITSLIKNDTKRLQMKKAVQNYLNKASLLEYERIAVSLLGKVSAGGKEFTDSVEVRIPL